MAATVRYIRLNVGAAAVYNYIPIIYSVVYMLIFLINTGVCIGSLVLGYKLIKVRYLNSYQAK